MFIGGKHAVFQRRKKNVNTCNDSWQLQQTKDFLECETQDSPGMPRLFRVESSQSLHQPWERIPVGKEKKPKKKNEERIPVGHPSQ